MNRTDTYYETVKSGTFSFESFFFISKFSLFIIIFDI